KRPEMDPYKARIWHVNWHDGGVTHSSRRLRAMARSAGFGSIRKPLSTRWQARYYGPDTRYHSGPHTFQTKADAQGWLVRERQLITDGTWAPPAVRAQRAAQAELERREHTLA